MSFHLHLGPCHHTHILEKAFNHLPTYSQSTYWPQFQYINDAEITTSFKKSLQIRILNFLRYHTNYLSEQELNEKIFYLYDLFVCEKIKSPTVLWTLPQVGLQLIKKVKKQGAYVVLEHPMIHVLEHENTLKNEYEKFSIPEKKRRSAFTVQMIDNMLEEYELANKINVLSSYSFQSFRNQGIPASKLSITLPGIDTLFWKSHYKSKPKNTPFILLFVGRIELQKGIHLLIEAFLEAKLPNAILKIIGSETDESSYLYKKHPAIFYQIYSSKNDLQTEYQQADLVVVPSLFEGFGLVILEALASGAAVIASETTGGGDILPKHCLFTPTVEALKLKLVEKYVSKISDIPSLNHFTEEDWIKRYQDLNGTIANR